MKIQVAICNLDYRQKEKMEKYIPFVDEFGLYEILFRTNSKLSSDFKLEVKQLLKQQRLQQNILLQEKIYQLEQQQEELNQKIIDQQIQHEQELENRELDYDFDPEDDEEDSDITSSPQMICVSKNLQQIFNNYIIKLNKHYKQELNYHFVILQNRMKRDQAFQFKSDYLTNVFGCCKTQHNSEQSVTPLFK